MALGAPFLSLDTIKENLYGSGAEKRDPHELRRAAEAELFVEVGAADETVVVDIWIAPERDTNRLATLLGEQEKNVVELLCRVPADVAVARYVRRHRSGPHRPADLPTLQRIQDAVDHIEPMPIGNCIEIDTSQPVDIDSVIDRLHL